MVNDAATEDRSTSTSQGVCRERLDGGVEW